jgi:hypothetical protein
MRVPAFHSRPTTGGPLTGLDLDRTPRNRAFIDYEHGGAEFT